MKESQTGTMGCMIFECFDFGGLVSADAAISDSAINILKTSNDKRYFGPPPGPHLSELKSG